MSGTKLPTVFILKSKHEEKLETTIKIQLEQSINSKMLS